VAEVGKTPRVDLAVQVAVVAVGRQAALVQQDKVLLAATHRPTVQFINMPEAAVQGLWDNQEQLHHKQLMAQAAQVCP
jgi:hypothetical protein